MRDAGDRRSEVASQKSEDQVERLSVSDEMPEMPADLLPTEDGMPEPPASHLQPGVSGDRRDFTREDVQTIESELSAEALRILKEEYRGEWREIRKITE